MPLHIRVIVIAALSVLVVALRHWSLAHLSVFLLFSLGVAVINVQAFKVSAISIFVAFTASTVLVRFYGPTRDTLSWFQKGVIDRVSALLMLGTSVIAALALIIWAEWTDNLGVGFTMMKGVAHYPTWMVAGIILPLFAVLNAFSEEVAYRGILQEALQRNLTNTHLVLVLQSSAFAALHYAAGFPNGILGFLMAFSWGLMLGYLRQRSRGLLAPWLVHLAADLVIFYYLYSQV